MDSWQDKDKEVAYLRRLNKILAGQVCDLIDQNAEAMELIKLKDKAILKMAKHIATY